MTSLLVRIAGTIAFVIAALVVGVTTRPAFIGKAANFDAALPTDASDLPGYRHCGSWWLDGALDATTGAPIPIRDGAVRIAAGHPLDLSGWAYIQGRRETPRAMIWVWEHGEQELAMYPLKREDVAEKERDHHALFSGFFAALNTAAHPRGTHSLDILIVEHGGDAACWFEDALTVVIT